MATKKPALGRGLSALLENSDTDITGNYKSGESRALGSVAMISIDQIEANPFQPRTHFEKEALLELSESIKEHGIIQPVTVRKMGYDKYQLISGERRFRASQLANLKEIPAYIRVANDQAMLEMALVENLQREDLDAIEVALSFKRLLEECNLTQEALSEKVSKSRPAISNFLRLLKLPAEIQAGIRARLISMGHARALINITDTPLQLAIFRRIVEDELSVREVEQLVRSEKQIDPRPGKEKRTPAGKSSAAPLSFTQQKACEELKELLNTRVEFKKDGKGKGKITIAFTSDEDLDRILQILHV